MKDCILETATSELIDAAKSFHDLGLHPMPIYYEKGDLKPPKEPNRKFAPWDAVRGMFETAENWRRKECDAIALDLRFTNLTWLDLDNEFEVDRWLSQVSPEVLTLPRYNTSRGMHIVCRFPFVLPRAINLRPDIVGELRGGNCLCIVPPSYHRTITDVQYRWVNPLPQSLSEVPMFTLLEVVPYLRAEVQSRVEGLTGKEPSTGGTKGSRANPLGCLALPGEKKKKPNMSQLGTVAVGRLSQSVRKLIVKCLPYKRGERRPRLAKLMRELKLVKPDWSSSELNSVAMCWWKIASRKGLTNDVDGRETISSLKWLYDEYNPSSGLLCMAAGMLDSAKPVESVRYLRKRIDSQQSIVRLATLCRLMQSLSDSPSWFLPCRLAAFVTGTSKSSAARDLALLCDKGYINCVDQSKFTNDGTARLANYYVWTGIETSAKGIDNEKATKPKIRRRSPKKKQISGCDSRPKVVDRTQRLFWEVDGQWHELPY